MTRGSVIVLKVFAGEKFTNADSISDKCNNGEFYFLLVSLSPGISQAHIPPVHTIGSNNHETDTCTDHEHRISRAP